MRTALTSFTTTTPPPASDAVLAQRACEGEHDAFCQIMRRYNQRLYRLAVSVMGDASEAEDVLQESYVRAFYALGEYAGKGSLGAWLARIVRNEAIDRLRTRKSRRRRILLEADLDGPWEEESALAGLDSDAIGDQPVDPSVVSERADVSRMIERAIERLPEHFRTVFMLREVEGLSVEETAEYLQIPPATVKTRDHRARALLRSYLSENIEEAIPRTFSFMAARCDRLVERVLKRLRQ
ncbi:MAG TPA: RNA polymerase sigma factor [Steroidobacteraceae bacterium]|jgi:RNA polymerase sigma-70 factor (ECF subfamily)